MSFATATSPVEAVRGVGAAEGFVGVRIVLGTALGDSVNVVISVGGWVSMPLVSDDVGLEVPGPSSTAKTARESVATARVGIDETDSVGEPVSA